MEKYYYGYNEFLEDTKVLINKVKPYGADVLLGISRGGLTLSHFMGQALDNRNVFTLNSIHYNKTEKLDTFDIFNIPDLSKAKKVLILDDIIDTGETMVEILKILNEKFPHVEFKLATLFYKKTALISPDFTVKEAPAWIDFLWEVDI
ncbi:phosphoribosyltransferase [Candidatus Marinarcus aquaticus]|uniref:Nicotinate phosphoribosyltransferase n=1 Tax=Candidatus Marinarcus aquaticus TaxID=2044504 RepID=A0A4Q0XSY0_9BACT|nr:phosphoribosyltransferase family protein [Candidatus Marinarcus aquaticus]RXJ59935.1 nicotinate phosphoribosyltransferase [Candidatus Marinarcus aquaticus]